MKIIEGLKQLKIIEKRMDTNTYKITEYASMLSTERPVFVSAEEQKKEVAALVQANMDLALAYRKLKGRIDMTNLLTEVQIGKDKYTIAEMLVLKRGLGARMLSTFSALNDSQAEHKLKLTRSDPSGKTPSIERLYDERTKNEKQRKVMDLLDEIEMKLEVINATVDLVE